MWNYEMLEQSIKENGVKIPVVFNQYGRLIDGFHRKKIAEKLGIDYPKQFVKTKDNGDEEINKLSVAFTSTRGNLSPEQINEWAKERKKIALEARKNGTTQQEAALLAGVSQSTISRWEKANKNKKG